MDSSNISLLDEMAINHLLILSSGMFFSTAGEGRGVC